MLRCGLENNRVYGSSQCTTWWIDRRMACGLSAARGWSWSGWPGAFLACGCGYTPDEGVTTSFDAWSAFRFDFFVFVFLAARLGDAIDWAWGGRARGRAASRSPGGRVSRARQGFHRLLARGGRGAGAWAAAAAPVEFAACLVRLGYWIACKLAEGAYRPIIGQWSRIQYRFRTFL